MPPDNEPMFPVIGQCSLEDMFRDEEGRVFREALKSPLAKKIKQELDTVSQPFFMTGTADQMRLARFDKDGMTWERDARLDKNGNLVLTPVVDLEVRSAGAGSTKKTQGPKKDPKEKATDSKTSK
ncbi:unnamed protein product [Penicillium manginii]